MTCIVALKEAGEIYMAADSAGTNGFSLVVRKDPKIYMVDDLIIGFTSSFRMGQLLGYHFKKPEHETEISDLIYINTIFVEAVRNLFKEFGYSKIENNNESGGSFLVGYRGEIYRVSSDFHIGQSYEDFSAIGCGEDIALGSLNSTKTIPAINRLELALEASEKFSAGVRGPFIFYNSVVGKIK